MKSYRIDLSESDPGVRWWSLIEDIWAINTTISLTDEMWKSMTHVKKHPVVTKIMKLLVNSAAFLSKGLPGIDQEYREEVYEIAMFTCGERNALLGNLAYELAQVAGLFYGAAPEMCTSGAVYIPKHGMVHMRNMDWDLDGLRNGSIVLNFTGAPAGPFSAVSFPGYVGVISGVARGRFSATVNMAATYPDFNPLGKPIAMLVREMFETCPDFDTAVDWLSRQTAMSPAYVHIVGPKKGQSTVVEVFCFGRNGVYDHQYAVANHPLDDIGYTDEEWDFDSEERQDQMEAIIRRQPASPESAARSIKKKFPLYSELSHQSMVMVPKAGKLIVSRH